MEAGLLKACWLSSKFRLYDILVLLEKDIVNIILSEQSISTVTTSIVTELFSSNHVFLNELVSTFITWVSEYTTGIAFYENTYECRTYWYDIYWIQCTVKKIYAKKYSEAFVGREGLSKSKDWF